MEFLLCALIGYLIGSFNPSYIYGKIKGMDIRRRGSGNAGASNALIIFGKLIGVIFALLDIAKPCIAFAICRAIWPENAYVYAVTCAFCIIGHMFPFYMSFKGGKGLACLGGTVLCFDPLVFVIMLAVAVVVVLIVDYLCVVPITAALAFPVIYYLMTRDWISALILLGVGVIMVLKHIENLKRIRAGQEVHLSYLWKKDAELARVNKNAGLDITKERD